MSNAAPCVNVWFQRRLRDARRRLQFDTVPDAVAHFALILSGERFCRMTAFIIGKMQIHSREWMDEYFSKIPEVVARYRGQFLVRGGHPESLEGDNALPDAAFIIEFPDRSFAKDFWGSKEFQALAVLRRTGSSLNAILVDKLA
ncbi:uncharacterized protein (DUF1330 family) [Tritonibacter scottomollicae]|uniref:Uncharacterized protein (DUF1330 family) n=2 Tax=Tritonibacter scottomollicae TaxID=483013 RepID=A0A2T0ZZP2_TRISK|nr:uncharacterized protein (DUF1330 family) [Tritonibacter scottomollicae]